MARARGTNLAFAAALLALAGCAGGALAPGLPQPSQGARAFAEILRSKALGKIDHVVIIIQENRSVDNLFFGLPGADTRNYGYDSKNKKVMLRPMTLATTFDLEHSSFAFIASCNGTGTYPGTHCRMNGFNKENPGCGKPGEPHCPFGEPQYAYVPHDETKPYFDMAKQWVFADHMFASNFDESSFVSHQYIIAGKASSSVNVPEGGPWGCGGGPGDLVSTVTKQRTIGPNISPCLNNETLGDELDKAGISWGYYTANLNDGDGFLWSAYQAIKHIRYSRHWHENVIAPQKRFFGIVKAGKLPAVSWITPTCANSDHAGCDSATGPDWVASLVNTIGESPYWKSTAIFVFWDDPGGWYDHVAPKKLDYDGLGFRVPLLVISPYAKAGFVSHVRYEHGSLLQFIEKRFGLAALAATDARADSPESDCFDFNQAPRAFVPIQTKLNAEYFESAQPPDPRIPDRE